MHKKTRYEEGFDETSRLILSSKNLAQFGLNPYVRALFDSEFRRGMKEGKFERNKYLSEGYGVDTKKFKKLIKRTKNSEQKQRLTERLHRIEESRKKYGLD